MVPEASPFWQNAFLAGMFVVVGWCVWRGWRVGVVRAVASMVGLGIGVFVGIGVGGALGAISGAALPAFGGTLGLLAGAAAGLLAYGAVSILSALLFKRTAQQRTGLLRFGYGAGGAAVGAFVGLSVLWAALLFVRGVGGLCEAGVETPGALHGVSMSESAARTVVKLKKSIEAGDTGKALVSVDVMPAEVYRVLEKFGKLMVDPRALQRFVDYPEMREVLADSKFLRLVEDPDVQDLARSHDTGALMRNPKLLEAVGDPGLIGKLQKIDIEKALDYALGKSGPAASPASSPTPAKPPSHP